MSEQELQHWGIKGMKWGIRRFQKRDGTLTSAGKKRYSDGDSDGKAEGGSSKSGSKGQSGSKKEDISKMSDSELKSAINRLQLEKQYRDLKPQQVSLGKQFMEKTIKPALMDGGKKLLQDYLVKAGSKALGLDAEDAVNSMKLLKKPLSELSDAQIRTLSKRYENISTIKKGRNDEKTVDEETGNTPKSRSDNEATINKGQKDEQTVNNSTSNKTDSSMSRVERKKKKKKSEKIDWYEEMRLK